MSVNDPNRSFAIMAQFAPKQTQIVTLVQNTQFPFSSRCEYAMDQGGWVWAPAG
jgi:hypothetical protein